MENRGCGNRIAFLLEYSQDTDDRKQDSENRTMIDPEEHQPWDALAEELGLPPEPAGTSAAPAREEPPASVASPVPEETAPGRGRRRRGVQSAEDNVEVPPPDVAPPEPPAAAEVGEPGASATGDAEAEEPRGRGRRRGRRGGRAAPSGPAAETAPEA